MREKMSCYFPFRARSTSAVARYCGLVLAVLLLQACTSSNPPVPATPEVVPVHYLPLADDFSLAEFSGLAWYGDWLLLLPQFPERYAPPGAMPGEGRIFALPRADVLKALDSPDAMPLTPRAVPFFAGDVPPLVHGFEGFEAIAFVKDTAFVTVESRLSERTMLAHLVRGHVSGNLDTLRIDPATLTPLTLPAAIDNMSFEALLTNQRDLLAIFEINGGAHINRPRAIRLTNGLERNEAIPFPRLEYRVTDATTPDKNGRFWVINYFWPGERDRIAPDRDRLASPGQDDGRGVERLVAMQWTRRGVRLTRQPPLWLQPDAEGRLRNWEGIARLEGRGFLLITDEFPRTLLGFVPFPDGR